MAQLVKNLPATQETWVQSLDPLEKGKATHSSILAWRTPWTTQPMVSQTKFYRASLLVQMVKCLPAMPKTQIQSSGQEDPLEKEMATHSSPLAWKIPWMKEPGRLQSMESQRVGHD